MVYSWEKSFYTDGGWVTFGVKSCFVWSMLCLDFFYFFLVWIVTLIIQLKAKNKTMWPSEFLSLLNNQAACMHTKALQSCSTLCNPIDSTAPGSSWPWDSLGENIGVGWHACLQGIFLTQGSNLCLLCCLHRQVASLPLAPPGKTSIRQYWLHSSMAAAKWGQGQTGPFRRASALSQLSPILPVCAWND